MKLALFEGLSKCSRMTQVEVEKHLGNVVADIYAYNGNVHVAFEVQISDLTMEEIIRRTTEYEKLGVYLLWLPAYATGLGLKCYSPRQWEKWLHVAYLGRVYYWLEGLKVLPVHFDSYELYVEGSSWFEPGGEERHAGDYYRKSKRYRTPMPGPELSLDGDFCAKPLGPYTAGNIEVPKRLVLMDKTRRWWSKNKRGA